MTNELADLKMIRAIRKAVQVDSTIIPVFIDNTNISHRYCFDTGTTIINKLVPLFSNKTLTDRQIKSLFANINSSFDEMSVIDASITLHYYSWILQILEAYKKLCIENELWECASNVKNFEDLVGIL